MTSKNESMVWSYQLRLVMSELVEMLGVVVKRENVESGHGKKLSRRSDASDVGPAVRESSARKSGKTRFVGDNKYPTCKTKNAQLSYRYRK